MAVLTSMVFLGALLLFGMEPLVGRLLAPFLGGAAHVWLICLMFFQAMLFFGYLYSHLFARKIGHWHLLLLFLPLVVLPFDIQPPAGIESPVIQILVVLILHAALPFVVLSTTAIVAQVWLAGSSLGEQYDPYPLYGASNAGSFAALFGYSFLVEPLMGLRIQSLSWTALYLVYMALACASWFLLFRGNETGTQASEIKLQAAGTPVSHSLYLKWILLSCLPSALLLAVTNLIILEIGSFPLTWIFPLALYLLSFIVTFRTRGGMPGYLMRLWPEILMVAMMLYLLGQGHWFISIITLILFFLICLVAHGTLYETRPPTRSPDPLLPCDRIRRVAGRGGGQPGSPDTVQRFVRIPDPSGSLSRRFLPVPTPIHPGNSSRFQPLRFSPGRTDCACHHSGRACVVPQPRREDAAP